MRNPIGLFPLPALADSLNPDAIHRLNPTADAPGTPSSHRGWASSSDDRDRPSRVGIVGLASGRSRLSAALRPRGRGSRS